MLQSPIFSMATAVAGEASCGSGEKMERFYRPELDCLRFFAFFGVFVHHTLAKDAAYYATRHIPFGSLIASAVSAGRFGVDLFFLLSAYLITELLLRERERFGSVDVISFYRRRILRIWPLYFLAILIGVLLPLADPRQHFPLKYALAFVFLSGNWLFSFAVDIRSIMVILWSVSFEEQFYLLWPFFVSRVRTGRALLYGSAGMLVIAMWARILLLGHARLLHSEVAIFTNTLTRLDPLAMGIATAVLLNKKRCDWGWLSRVVLLAGGCAVWLTAGHFFRLTMNFMLAGYPAMAVGAWLIFLSALGSRIAPGWLRYLGKISYGLYVFHGLALYISAKCLGESIHNLRDFVLYWVWGLAMTVGMAALSYRFFESPFLRLKDRFARVKSRPV